MSTDIMAAQMSTKGITLSRAQTGWIFREDKRVRPALLVLPMILLLLLLLFS